MLLTKDNLLRFVQQHKYTTPTHVAKEFETTTTIASAALGELTNGGGLGSSHIKYGTTPYYYDMRQKECLVEIAKKTFSGTEQELFLKIQDEQIVSLNTLTIPQRAIMSKLQDIYYEIQIKKEEKTYTFLIWFLRDKNATYKQIQEALFGSNNNKTSSKNSAPKNKTLVTEKKNSSTSNLSNSIQNTPTYTGTSNNNSEQQYPSNPFSNLYSSNQLKQQYSNNNNNINNNSSSHKSSSNHIEKSSKTAALKSSSQTPISNIGQTNSDCDKYLYDNGFTILEKEKHSLGFLYKVTTPLNEFSLNIDALYIEKKKIHLKEIIEFYTSSMRPKIVFHSNLPKKIEQSVKEFENCIIIEIKN
ncbi:MAG: hypothetical protein ACMXYB_02360 [Candidatus Woesearchaeota archaeon]